MKEFIQKNDRLIEWLLGAIVVILPLIAWLTGPGPKVPTLDNIFPPLGLVAFGLMWTHFVMGALRRYAQVEKTRDSLYMPISMGLVLGLIILHPGLLWLELYMNGYGLPPESYLKAYQTQLLMVLLGSLSLTIFLAYEFKRFFGEKRWWKYVEGIQILGMVAIFIHAIGLGRDLKSPWFEAVWLVYGVTLAAAYLYSRIVQGRQKAAHVKHA